MGTEQQSSSGKKGKNSFPTSSKAGGTESWAQGPWQWRGVDSGGNPFANKSRKCQCNATCETEIADKATVLAIIDYKDDLNNFGKMRTVVLEEHLADSRSTVQGIYSIMALDCAQSASVDPRYLLRNRSFYAARSNLRQGIMDRLISNRHMYKRDIDLSLTKVSGTSCLGCLEGFSDDPADPLVTVSTSKYFDSGWTMHARCIPGYVDQTHVDSDETVKSDPQHGTTRSEQPNLEHQANHVSTGPSFDARCKPPE